MAGNIFDLSTKFALTGLRRVVLFTLCSFTLAGLCLSYYPIASWLSNHPEFIRNKFYVDVPKYLLVIKLTLLTPVLEELIFRLPLQFDIKHVRISFICLVSSILLMPEFTNIFTETGPYFLLRLSAALVICVLFVAKVRGQEVISRLKGFWEVHFYKILWASIILFSLFHWRRFSITDPQYFYLLLISFSAIVIWGLFFAFVRLRLGIIYSIIFHAINNSWIYMYVLFIDWTTGDNQFQFL